MSLSLKLSQFLFFCAVKNNTLVRQQQLVKNYQKWKHSHAKFDLFKAKWQYPCPQQVSVLNHCHQNPQETVQRLLSPVSMVQDDAMTSHVEHRFGGNIWRVTLCFKWPCKFRVTGQSEHRQRAVHYAYLSACDMFLNLGLLLKNSKIVDVENKLEEIRLISTKLYGKVFSLRTQATGQSEGDQIIWTARLHCNWPLLIDLHATSHTRKTAVQNVAALMVVRLKAHGFLNNHHNLCASFHSCLPRYSNSSLHVDYELYVDASRIGYGAYLLCPPTSPDILSGQIRWLQETWPTHIVDSLIYQPNFLEFYGLVCAIYTWKKRFVNTTVLCYSDNSSVVQMVNEGLTLKNKNHSHKLFHVLWDTCINYRITLKAKHVRRYDNVAADHLSKLKTDKFHAMMPNACERSKKTKKLMFFQPLTDQHHRKSKLINK